MNHKILDKLENMIHVSPKLLRNPETLRQAIRGAFAVDVEDVSYNNIGELVDKIDNLVLDSPSLTVPHPRMHERLFTLMPLLEISPDSSIPNIGPIKKLVPLITSQQIKRIDS